MSDKLDKLLVAANQRLKSGNVGISIIKRGAKLSLRGMLPPKPGGHKNKYSQQTISLGIFANGAGIKRAEQEAHKLSAQIALNEFSWSDYLKEENNINTVTYWLARFEEDYFSKRQRNSKTETTWSDYQKIFRKLPPEAKLNEQTLLETILSTTPDTRTRKKACTYLKALAKLAGIVIDFSEYSGSYSPSAVNPRDIPTDAEIQQWRDRIPNSRGWQYAFGLIAAYGLRNYELFYADLESIAKSPGHLRIRESKINAESERIIWCLYPEWWKKWELGNINQPFPKITGKNNSELGNRVTQALGRYGFNKPYNLRHAWAIRAINFIPVEIAARMMDHDLSVHTRIYQRWINQNHYEKMYEIMMNRNDRPLPPPLFE